MKLTLLTLILTFTLFGCSDDSSKGTMEKAADKVGETVDDVQQEACETVNGKVECAADRVKEDAQEALD